MVTLIVNEKSNNSEVFELPVLYKINYQFEFIKSIISNVATATV